jgi:hypothetical protein
MPLTDATSAARNLQTSIHQQLTPAAKFLVAMEMSDFTHALAEAGVRARKPGHSESEIRKFLIEALYGNGKTRP